MEKSLLDLKTFLQGFRQSGDLYGDIPAKKLRNKAPWKARMRVVEGRITSCQILDNRGAIVNSGEPALETLYALGKIYWEMIVDPPKGTGNLATSQAIQKSGTLPNLPAPDPLPASSSIPYRLVNVSLQQMNQTRWPSNYRLVYILVDGTRTSEKIASMLTMPLADVEQILCELQTMRIIDLNP